MHASFDALATMGTELSDEQLAEAAGGLTWYEIFFLASEARLGI
ncbi:MAG: hypothetical protein AVDCRST_MAG49-1212 [uncultured Thermomicrobiales bacterium]|uniref:Uncharacterized protein n=1 Tax=uncultured Thermomicrobiales bacterium TaxID=1645740 RepID=A0A6J4UBI3_9BACT|nr:MAG: hypothetical protein AVDCRST_MAG49-1212 [uncultured Thermomicrobiales bacterium]